MKEIFYPEIGKVLYVKNNKAKVYRIKINSKGELIVTVPKYGTIKQAEKFVLSKKEWIIKSKEKIAQKQKHYQYGKIIYNDNVILEIIPKQDKIYSIDTKVDDKTNMKLYFPEHIDINTNSSQEIIRKCLDKMFSFVANHHLREKTEEISKITGLQYKSLKINSAKTRWGSCSSENNINLSKYLISLPDKLINYVIIHELCHTVHKNHSSKFYELLDFHCQGREKELRRELKSYHIVL